MSEARKYEAFTGSVIGRWTVLGPAEPSAKGERRWHCRCSCGTERSVSERGLIYGASLSCGCATRENAGRARAHDLTGRTFGDLTVTAPPIKRNGKLYWPCRCACGAVCEILGTHLATGKRTHCGCRTVRQYAYADITGQRYHRLTVQYRHTQRSEDGSILWHCLCDCGNEIDVSYNALVYGNMKSCGCRKKEHDQALHGYLTHIAGTSVDMLRSEKTPRNNTTGVKGVYRIRGKYVAKIVFQKKQYVLGKFDDIQSAAEARAAAEETINRQVVAYYARWKRRADADPEWAQENPVQIFVSRNSESRFSLSFLPELDEKHET